MNYQIRIDDDEPYIVSSDAEVRELQSDLDLIADMARSEGDTELADSLRAVREGIEPEWQAVKAGRVPMHQPFTIH